MNTPISYSLHKLLKEKGFVCTKSDKFWRDGFSYEKKDCNPIAYQDKDNVATIADIIMWLYEKYKIWIGVDIQNNGKWFFNISDVPHTKLLNDNESSLTEFKSLTEAYEAAIEYFLRNKVNNLIAEEFLKIKNSPYSGDYWNNILIEFARMHCKAQLEAIIKNVNLKGKYQLNNGDNPEKFPDIIVNMVLEQAGTQHSDRDCEFQVNINSILNAYPLDLIK